MPSVIQRTHAALHVCRADHAPIRSGRDRTEPMPASRCARSQDVEPRAEALVLRHRTECAAVGTVDEVTALTADTVLAALAAFPALAEPAYDPRARMRWMAARFDAG